MIDLRRSKIDSQKNGEKHIVVAPRGLDTTIIKTGFINCANTQCIGKQFRQIKNYVQMSIMVASGFVRYTNSLFSI